MGTHTPFLPEILTEWLPAQRWFPARGKDISITVVGGTVLDDPTGQAALEVNFLAVGSGRRTDVVNVPLSYRAEPLPEAASGLLGQIEHPDLGKRWVYDATHDPAFVDAWVELMRVSGASADGRVKGLALENLPVPTPKQPIKVLKGEQSNTSVVVGSGPSSMIVKFFRVLAAGKSPDVDICAGLTAEGSTDVPATFGWVTGEWQLPNTEPGNHVTGHLSVLRDFIEGSTDAWRVASLAASAGTDFSAEAHELGALVARIHRQLESAFGSSQATAAEQEAFKDALTRRIEWAWAEAGTAVGPLNEDIEAVLAQVRALDALPALQRIHADLHLGQILRAPDGSWLMLDFEGEPLRPTAERSVPDVPLRDVVGMVRSLEYAAASRGASPEGSPEALAGEQWAAAATSALLAGYASEAGSEVDPVSPLFRALWLDKALYEVVYELRNRPEWVEMPARDVRHALTGQPLAAPVGAMAAAVSSGTPASSGAAAEPPAAPPAPTGAGSGAGSTTGQVSPAAASPSLAGGAASGAPKGTSAPSGPPSDPTPIPVPRDVLQQVSDGMHHQPHAVLGAHLDDSGTVTIRTLRRLARSVVVVTGSGRTELTHEHNGIWVGAVPAESPGHVPDYRLEVAYGGEPQLVDDPYRFLPTLGEIDMHLIAEGRHETLWTALGAHVRHYSSVLGAIDGVSFAVWAPSARAVRVKADFNGWDGSINAMRALGSSGVWEIFIPGAQAGAVYKYEILGSDGQWREKADPMARGTEVPPLTGSRVVESRYAFEDDAWMTERASKDPHNGPMSVYEVHLASWRVGLSYRDLAEQLVEYVTWQGFTHVELMPVAEHPFGGSWGYQVTSYFAPTSRFGHPDDFKYLVDKLHQAGIGVIMDWVPAHFPKDEWALAKFDGGTLYEHGDPLLGEHMDWGTLIFDFGRREVRNFLVANALYWLEEFHIDGLRVDAVASMLYLDYSREEGQWRPNRLGGRENLEAISFLQEVTATAYKRAPGIVMIAEESTAFPGVTRPTSAGGLGFGLKWNMGWMHDTLQYMAEDPINRSYHHGKATFSMVYAYTENFLLPISHDEVVHGKGSLLRKMPGDRWQQLANVRAYLAFQWAHPGKQLIFMGSEFAQESEWAEQHGLDWWLCDTPPHRGVQELVRSLNTVYRETPAMYARDNEPAGFQWIDENDGGRNTLSFIRWDHQGNPLVCVANFAGGPHEGFRVGLPWAGEWAEVLNTDAEQFGGSGVGNGDITAIEGGHNGQPAHADLRVPPLGVLYLAPRTAKA
ncbi:1,4-alpha-glucan branching protein GlgB [Arthrobacter sp. MSA 4-2]|uniref:1,4-alpha-glucan branching protein GlgB n=1 Tax=Arthrobacter sp. MSA 4-2 TaxID=2794349 RepID=UPI0018E8E144|nr:1,4-alpha-glucan branching protein GlgB [Arthrobacter sp. MSA 4-2]MBJ2120902.1 1,4-alpha-glucan branching protein GlgB [Arthrobacter sp. MSA 4-2]